MLRQYQTKTNIGVGLGTLLLLSTALLFRWRGIVNYPYVPLALATLAIPLFIWGCCMYAIGKGYSWVLGLLGGLGWVGLLVLALLPDRHKVVRRSTL